MAPVNIIVALIGAAQKGHLKTGAKICNVENVCPKCDEEHFEESAGSSFGSGGLSRVSGYIYERATENHNLPLPLFRRGAHPIPMTSIRGALLD